MAKMIIGLIAGIIVLGAIVVFYGPVRTEVEGILFGEPVISDATAPTRDRMSQIGNKVGDALGVEAETPTQNAPAGEGASNTPVE